MKTELFGKRALASVLGASVGSLVWEAARWSSSFCLFLALIFAGYASVTDEQTQASRSRRSATTTGSKEDHRKKPDLIWRGRSDGFDLEWRRSDLIVSSRRGEIALFSALARPDETFAELVGDLSDAKPHREPIRDFHCSYERHFELLSVVGSLVSIMDGEFISCGVHPTYYDSFLTIDLKGLPSPGEFVEQLRADDHPDVKIGEIDEDKIGEIDEDSEYEWYNQKRAWVAKLTDFFAEEQIVEALLADRLVQRVLGRLEKWPKSFGELARIFNERARSIQNDPEHELDLLRMAPDMLSRFAFDHVEGDKVAVHLSLVEDLGASRYGHRPIELLLPIPERLREGLLAADARRSGFLMKDAKEISRGKETKFARERIFHIH